MKQETVPTVPAGRGALAAGVAEEVVPPLEAGVVVPSVEEGVGEGEAGAHTPLGPHWG